MSEGHQIHTIVPMITLVKMLDVLYAAITCGVLSLCWITPCSSLPQSKGRCPLWHIRKENGKCNCGESCMYNGLVSCDKTFVYILQGNCLTWNNSTSRAELHSCLFSSLWDAESIQCGNNNNIIPIYRVLMNIW